MSPVIYVSFDGLKGFWGFGVFGITMLTHTFRYAEIRDMDAVFLGTLKIKVDVGFQIFLLLRSGFHLHVALMWRIDNFLADFTMDLSAAGMSFE